MFCDENVLLCNAKIKKRDQDNKNTTLKSRKAICMYLDGLKQSLVIPKVAYDQEATYSVKLNEKVSETQLQIQGWYIFFK